MGKILIILIIFAHIYGQHVISDLQQQVFNDLFNGSKMWPVWKVPDSTIMIDGVLDENTWLFTAERIYISGEWMFNGEYFSEPGAWTGFGDFIGLVRVLYDNEKLYVSIMHYDDFHNEGDEFETWEYNDAVEIAIQPAGHDISMFGAGDICSIVPGQEFMLAITRRFTEKEGLQSFEGQNCTRCPPGEYEWFPPCPEPWNGIRCAAKQVQDPEITERYEAAWCMECEFPFNNLNFSSAFANRGYSVPPEPGPSSYFKMNIRISDDDAEEHGFMGSGGRYSLRRYCDWWGPVECYLYGNWSNVTFYPTWQYAGYKTPENMEAVSAYLPDNNNYYCSTPFVDYDEAVNIKGIWKRVINFSVEPDTIHFDTVPVGDTVHVSVKIKNTGDTLIHMSEITIDDTPGFIYQGDSAYTIAVDDSIIFRLGFAPGYPRHYSATISADFIYGKDGLLPLDGSGITKGSHLIAAQSHFVGLALKDRIKRDTLYIYNEGLSELKIDSIYVGHVSDVFSSYYDKDSTVAPGESVGISVAFKPDREYTNYWNWLIIKSDSEIDPVKKIIISGRSQENPGNDPEEFLLSNLNPNPFRSFASLDLAVPETEEDIRLAIYDLNGKLVRILVNGRLAPGVHNIHFNGLSQRGRELNSGIYFLSLETRGYSDFKKIVLVK
jgi:hypothetical protein